MFSTIKEAIEDVKKGKFVLVVDDDVSVLKLAHVVLTRADHEVLVTTEADQVVGIVENEKVDAIILDVMLGDRSGYEVLAELRRRPDTRKVIVLMLSALTKPVENLGIILLPLAALAIALELIYPSSHFLPTDSPWGLRVHVLISLIAYALLTMASVQAILLAIQDHHLHARQPGGFIRALPPLQTMESAYNKSNKKCFLFSIFILLSSRLLKSYYFDTLNLVQGLVTSCC